MQGYWQSHVNIYITPKYKLLVVKKEEYFTVKQEIHHKQEKQGIAPQNRYVDTRNIGIINKALILMF